MKIDQLGDILQVFLKKYPNTLGACVIQGMNERWKPKQYISWLKTLQKDGGVKELNNVIF